MEEKTRKDFRLKQLSAENIVLVNCNGYEQELFIPKIRNGRIVMENIIEARRCCRNEEIKKENSSSIDEKTSSKSMIEQYLGLLSKNKLQLSDQNLVSFSFSGKDASQVFRKKVMPIAKSTPVTQDLIKTKDNLTEVDGNGNGRPKIIEVTTLPRLKALPVEITSRKDSNMDKTKLKHLMCQEKENIPPECDAFTESLSLEQQQQSFPTFLNNNSTGNGCLNSTWKTPEIVRRAADCYQNLDISLPNPNNFTLSLNGQERYYKSKEFTSKNQGLILHDTKNILRSQAANIINSSPRLKNKLNNSPNTSNDSWPKTPNISARKLVKRSIILSNSKWRNVKTPKRTYSKRNPLASGKKIKIHTPLMVQKKIIPSFLNNPTQGIQSTHSLYLKKRKLLFDKNITITPKSFKSQISTSFSKEKRDKNFDLTLKKKKLYNVINSSAFDLLTNSNRALHMSAKLNNLFRDGCLNKSAPFISNYTDLCKLT